MIVVKDIYFPVGIVILFLYCRHFQKKIQVFFLLLGEIAGANADECGWIYAEYGYQIECPRSDEIVAGRCGSGQISRCPNGSNHGILCCELTVFNDTRIL